MGFLARLLKAKPGEESNISRALRNFIEADNPTSRRNLYNALCHQRLILPVPTEPDILKRDVEGRLQQPIRVDFFLSQESSGRKVLAVFTHPEALKNWRGDLTRWIAVDTPSICRMALESGVSVLKINPANQTFVELSLGDIRVLAKAEAGCPFS